MRLSLPELEQLLHMVNSNDWIGVRQLADHMIRVSSDGVMSKYGSAVTRLETWFKTRTGRLPWDPSWSPQKLHEHRRRLAWYIRDFSSIKPLIDDGEVAIKTGKKPRSLSYFMVSEKGRRESRWGLLLIDHRLAEHEKIKQEEKDWADKQKPSDLLADRVDPARQAWIMTARADVRDYLKAKKYEAALNIILRVSHFTGIDLRVEFRDLLPLPGRSGSPALPATGGTDIPVCPPIPLEGGLQSARHPERSEGFSDSAKTGSQPVRNSNFKII